MSVHRKLAKNETRYRAVVLVDVWVPNGEDDWDNPINVGTDNEDAGWREYSEEEQRQMAEDQLNDILGTVPNARVEELNKLNLNL